MNARNQNAWAYVSNALVVAILLQTIGRCFAEEVNPQLAAINRGVELFNAKKWPEAVVEWEKVVVANPVQGRAWLNLASAAYEAKQYRKAIAAYHKSYELRQGYPAVAAYDLACCYALVGEKEPALEWLQKALNLGFRDIQKVNEDEDLVSVREDPRFIKMVGIVKVGKLSRDDGWRFDIELLTREIKRCHFAPFHANSAEKFEAAICRLKDNVSKLNDDQLFVGCQKLLCMAGDGHTSMGGSHGDRMSNHRVAATFYFFEEGLFLTNVDPRFADLAGAQVLQINGHGVAEVLKALDTVVPKDNSMGLLWRAPDFLRNPRFLHGLDLISSVASMPMRVKDVTGKEREVTLPADTGMPNPQWVSARAKSTEPAPLYLKRRNDAYWFEHLPKQKAVYCQYNAVMNQGAETFEAFCSRMLKFVNEQDVEKLILDLRWNGGGNNFLNRPLIHGLIRCDKINQKGKLFVIAGRNTFSAAMCCAAELERHTKAIFVGEPTGSSPNFIGESAVRVVLPHSKIVASISDLYWQNSVAMDYRTWIAPSIYTPPTFAFFQQNRDPSLEAILPSLAPQNKVSLELAEPTYVVTTVAGNGERSFSGDGGPAVKAALHRPCAVAVDNKGQLFIADYGNHRIRKVTTDGNISTIAGNGEAGYAGDGGPATAGKLNGPYGVCVDHNGNVFIADQRNNRIRKVAPDGVLSTVAGNGERTFAGDGGPATEASLSGADAILCDGKGNLIIADSGNHRIRSVTQDGKIQTIAGTTQGYSGDGGPASAAKFFVPAALAMDQAGNLLIGDFRNHVVRKMDTHGTITTIAGTGEKGFRGDGGPAIQAQVNEPGGVGFLPDGTVLIADGINFRVRRITSDGTIGTIAGTGVRGFHGDGGPALSAQLGVLDILAIDAKGNVYLTDHSNNRIRKLTPARQD